MGTEIKVIYNHKPIFAKKEDFEEPFYCKETPFEVLKELFSKYHIQKYKTLDTGLGVLNMIPAKSESPGIILGNSIHITGLSIKSFQPKGIEITQSVKEYPPVPVKNITTTDIEEVFNEFIERYLIRKEIIDSGYATKNYLHQTKTYRLGKQKAIEYLKERENKKDDKKEKNLEDILEYGKVLFGEGFNLNKLKKISKKVAKKIPRKIKPLHIDYFTLRPSRNHPHLLRG